MIQTVKPFDVTYKLMNKKFKIIDTIGFDEPFILMTEIFCTSPWQLLIVGSHFNPVLSIVTVSAGVVLEPDPDMWRRRRRVWLRDYCR